MDLNLDFGRIAVTTQPPWKGQAQPIGPMFASVDGRVAALSANECVFQPRDGGDLHVMSHQVLQALDQCREFRTLDEHVARIASVIPGLAGQGEAVRRVLADLIERGMMRSDQQFLDALSASAGRNAVPLRALVVRACDRPTQLRSLLDSLREHQKRFQRHDTLIVIDDSRDAGHQQQHQDLVTRYAADTGSDARWIGPHDARAISDRLASARPEAAAVLPGLLQQTDQSGFGGGRGYNLAMLLTAGGALSLIDDDYLLPFHRASIARDGLEPQAWSAFPARFHRDLDAALASGGLLEDDGFALQQAMIGASLGQVLGDPAGRYRLQREQLRGFSLARLAHLRHDARVIATFTGSRGASFTSDSAWLFQLPPTSRDAFRAHPESYQRNVEADAIEYAPERMVAREFGLFTPFMLDNSQLLPCTAVRGRGEDGLFGVVSHYMHPDSLSLHLPITVGHRQEGVRSRFQRATHALTPGFNRFLREWVRNQAQPARAADPAERLSLLAAQLDDLAQASVASRVDILQEYLSYARADLIDQLQQQLLAESTAPAHWADDIRRIVEANGRALLDAGVPRLDDWPEDIDAAGCAQRLADSCSELAAAYRHWPAVWRTAAELGDQLLPG